LVVCIAGLRLGLAGSVCFRMFAAPESGLGLFTGKVKVL
jgi:hypothetical protein